MARSRRTRCSSWSKRKLKKDRQKERAKSMAEPGGDRRGWEKVAKPKALGQTMASALVAALPFWGDMKTAELKQEEELSSAAQRAGAMREALKHTARRSELGRHASEGRRRRCTHARTKLRRRVVAEQDHARDDRRMHARHCESLLVWLLRAAATLAVEQNRGHGDEVQESSSPATGPMEQQARRWSCCRGAPSRPPPTPAPRSPATGTSRSAAR